MATPSKTKKTSATPLATQKSISPTKLGIFVVGMLVVGIGIFLVSHASNDGHILYESMDTAGTPNIYAVDDSTKTSVKVGAGRLYAWSGAKDKLAYVDATSGNIYTVKPDGTGATNVYTQAAGAQVWSLNFSNDGTKLLFTLLSPTRSIDLYVKNLSTNTTKKIVSNVGGGNAYFSPNGKKVVYYSQLNDVTVASSSGLSPKVVIPHNGSNNIVCGMQDGSPWSPDSTKLLCADYFNTTDHVNFAMYSVNVGTLVKKTYKPQGFSPIWSPDGTQIMFRTSLPTGQYTAHIFTLATGKNATIPNVSAKAGQFDWSPVTGTLSFTEYTTSNTTYELYTIKPDGSAKTQVVSGIPYDGDASLAQLWRWR